MQLSNNEKKILEQFLLSKDSINAKDLAKELSVSTKTVYRMIKKINDFSPYEEIIYSEIGKGFKLNYDNYLKFVANQNFSQTSKESAEERRNDLLIHLLSKSPRGTNIYDLCENYFVSEDTIYKDMIQIKKQLKNHKLTIRKKGNFIEIIGNELNIRTLLYDLLSVSSLSQDNRYDVDNENINYYDLDFLTKQVQLIEEKLDREIAYPYNINIFSHLYILFSRFKEGIVSKRNSELERLDANERRLIVEYEQYFKVSKEVIQNICFYLQTNIPEIEVFYLFQYLMASNLGNNRFVQDTQIDTLQELVNNVVEIAEEILKVDLSELKKDTDFIMHFKLMLYRNRHRINIKNELLPEIKREYPMIFSTLERVFNNVDIKSVISDISIDELGFIVLYVAAAIERVKYKKRVIIMCSSGVGTSELIKVKVLRAFPDLEIVDVVSSNQFWKKYQSDIRSYADIVLTTVLLNQPIEVPVLLVSALFTQQDQKKVKKLLEENNYGKS